MKPANFSILYVTNVDASVVFYTRLLGLSPVEQSPGFAMFVTPEGFKIGLWLKTAVEPAVNAAGGGSEIMFDCDSDADVDATHADWEMKGAIILQKPVAKEFGYTFTAADPDGHRLRVYRMTENPM